MKKSKTKETRDETFTKDGYIRDRNADFKFPVHFERTPKGDNEIPDNAMKGEDVRVTLYAPDTEMLPENAIGYGAATLLYFENAGAAAFKKHDFAPNEAEKVAVEHARHAMAVRAAAQDKTAMFKSIASVLCVHSLYISEEYRHMHLGTKLLDFLAHFSDPDIVAAFVPTGRGYDASGTIADIRDILRKNDIDIGDCADKNAVSLFFTHAGIRNDADPHFFITDTDGNHSVECTLHIG